MGTEIESVQMTWGETLESSLENSVVFTGIVINWFLGNKSGKLQIITGNPKRQVLAKIDTESMGKEFFLDLMSKLYDMAEVK